MPTRIPAAPPFALAVVVSAIVVTALVVTGPVRAEDRERTDGSSVATATGVVVNGVDTRGLHARFQEVDRKLHAGESADAAADLHELLGGELDGLLEESPGVYVRAEEAALLRVAGLPPDALAAWRRLADPSAEALLDQAAAGLPVRNLARDARRLSLANPGPRLAVLVADRHLARGELREAGATLEDLLAIWRAAARSAGVAQELPGVARAAVVSRLAAVCAALRDPYTIGALLEREGAALLDGPSPVLADVTLREELRASAARAQARTRRAAVADVPLRAAGEWVFGPDLPRDGAPATSREIPSHAAAIEGPDGPLLLARIEDALGIAARLVAFAPPVSDERPAAKRLPRLEPKWSWPSSDELKRWPRGTGSAPFAPTTAGDLVFFCWPSTRSAETDGGRYTEYDEMQDLVVLSITAEGRVVEERGVGEEGREDPELARLSFCGRPLVLGDSVYVTLVGRSRNGGATELHVARFDLITAGGDTHLRERWRRHVLDGTSIAPARYALRSRPDVERPLAWPGDLAERFGRVYVASNSGAVTCVDGASGDVVWLETYERFGPSSRRTVLEGDPSTWKHGPAHVDGDRVYFAPRDSEALLVFAPTPLPSRSARVGQLAVRGTGTATEPGSPLGDLVADEVVGVRDGFVFLSGHLPVRSSGTIPWPPSPLLAYRMRAAREGEPAGRLLLPEVPETAAAGSPFLGRDGLLFPTHKALYRVDLGALESPATELWRADLADAAARGVDRLGNMLSAGGRAWSVTPSRIVLFDRR